MKTIEIITNFDLKQIDFLKDSIDLNSKTIIVNSAKLYRYFENSNRVLLLDQRIYFGFDTPYMNTFHRFCINRTEMFVNSFSKIDSSLPYGSLLRYQVIRELRFLQWAQSILTRERNVIFIFENSSSLYRSILLIAKDMGFRYKFGIVSLTNSIIQNNLIYNYKSKFKKFIDELDGLDDDIINKEISSFFQNHIFCIDDSTVVSFIQSDPLDMNTRSLWLVLEKLRSAGKSNLIFTYNNRTYHDVLDKQYNVINLREYFQQIEKINFTSSEGQIIKSFYDILYELKFKDGILNSYLESFFDIKKLTNLKLLLRNIGILKFLFNNSKLCSLFFSSDGQLVTDVACQLANHYKIKTIQISSIMHRWNSFRSYFYPASLICINGELNKKQLLAIDVDEKRLRVTGNPFFEHLSKISSSTFKINNNSKSKNILLALGRWQKHDEVWISEFIRYCNEHNHNLTIRPHPSYYLLSDPKDSSMWRLDLIEQNCNGLKYEFSTQSHITNHLNYDVVIIDYSTVGIEFALRGIPLIVITFGLRKNDLSGKIYLDENVALEASNTNDLYVILDLIINDSQIQKKYEEASILFRDKYECFDESGSIQNIINELL